MKNLCTPTRALARADARTLRPSSKTLSAESFVRTSARTDAYARGCHKSGLGGGYTYERPREEA
jgi:hypothetical protein